MGPRGDVDVEIARTLGPHGHARAGSGAHAQSAASTCLDRGDKRSGWRSCVRFDQGDRCRAPRVADGAARTRNGSPGAGRARGVAGRVRRSEGAADGRSRRWMTTPARRSSRCWQEAWGSSLRRRPACTERRHGLGRDEAKRGALSFAWRLRQRRTAEERRLDRATSCGRRGLPREKKGAIQDVVTLLAEGSPPAWATNTALGPQAPVPNLLAILRLHRVLATEALVRFEARDAAGAERALRAAWNLERSLRDRPEVLTQLIAISLGRRNAALVRRLAVAPDEWLEKLARHDYRRPSFERWRPKWLESSTRCPEASPTFGAPPEQIS